MNCNIDGLLPVHKPEGMVSKDVSRWLVKRAGKLRLGHVGTLDPSAGGVLPLLLGRATKLQDWLLELPKTYEFEVTFGSETDTLDRDGKVVRERPWEHVTEASLRNAATSFLGEIEQVPPAYSAVKFKGKPLYEYARKERLDDLPPLEQLKRRVRIDHFELLGYEGQVGRFRVNCSKGTYVRSLVKDVAEKVDSCGTLTRLVRTEAAGVKLAQAYGLEAIEERIQDLSTMVVPLAEIDLGLMRWQAQRRSDSQKLRNGQTLLLDAAEFLAGLSAREGVDMSLGAWDKPLLLVGDTGVGLGVGAVRRQETGRVVISMKRGL